MNERIAVIAEAGTNHNGQRKTAERLVDVAAEAKADSVKFQIIYPEGLYLPKLYDHGELTDNAVYAKRRAAMLADDDYRFLAGLCREHGLDFGASVFDERGLRLLDEIGAAYTKIASCDLNHSRLLISAAQRCRRLIISTGMATLGEIERAVADVARAGAKDVVLLHCVSEYPCPTERMNLAFIKVLQSAFGLPVGLSDHTENSLAAAAAVSLGVTCIEKHFTLDRKQEGFDHAYAMDPGGLAQYIREVRVTEQACRLQATKVGSGEAGVRARARRSLYAARDLAAGELMSDADVLVVRPEGPLAPNDLPLFVGRRVRRSIRRYAALTTDAFEGEGR